MAKISTLKTSVKTIETATEQYVSPGISQDQNDLPSAHIISNILNYSKALEMKRTSNGDLIENVLN